MILQNYLVKKLFIIAIIFGVNTIFSQETGQINGVLQSPELTPLPGGHVMIRELERSAVSNENGRFNFKGIPAGTYTLTATYIGFHPCEVPVTVAAGQKQQVSLICREDQQQLQEVVVTAEKRESTLQQVPAAVSALTAKTVEERKVRETGDLLLSVPNLTAMNAGAPTLTTLSIRGVLTFSTDPAVGIYVDGVPMFDGYSSSLQLLDIERVEVLRGPQSTLYGRNALGGIIHIITRKPGNTFRGFAETGWGNYNSQYYALGLSGPLVKDKLFAGFSGMYNVREGYFDNRHTGEKYDRPETYSGNFYLKYLASERFSLTLNLKGERNNIRGAFPYALNAEQAKENPFTVDQNGSNRENREVYTSSLLARYNTGKLTLSSMTAYTYLDDLYRDYDADYSPYDAIGFEMPVNRQKTLTQEFKLVTDNDKNWQFTGGLFGFIDRKKSETVYHYGPDYAAQDPNAPYSTYIHADKKVYGFAAYAHLTYVLGEQWKLTAGLRYDAEKRDLTHSTDYEKVPDPPMTVSPEQKIEGDNQAVSPKFNVSFTPSENVLLYATYARGYRQGGFNQWTSNPNLLNYEPEYTDNYELGVKSEWFNRRLRANAAFFYTKWKDQQQTLMAPENAIDNVGELTNKGLEAEFTALPFKGLEISYNFGLVDTEYQKLILPDETGNNQDFKGNKQVFTPAFTSALSLTYRHTFNDQWSLHFTPEWKLLGKQYLTYYNDLEQDPFSLFNASLGIQYKKLELGLWGKNLTDTRYLSFAYATYPVASSPVLTGAPLTYGISLKTSF